MYMDLQTFQRTDLESVYLSDNFLFDPTLLKHILQTSTGTILYNSLLKMPAGKEKTCH
jgi:hypothetical protein